MSPEQARGEAVDKRRADFGAVLYEMLTGERLFEGKALSDRLAGRSAPAPKEINVCVYVSSSETPGVAVFVPLM
jgi:hypothetical protein